jgi:hypothetical protein
VRVIFVEFHQAQQGVGEILESLRREHDGVAAAADVLGDFQKPAAVVFLQIEEKNLAVDVDFLRGEGVVLSGVLFNILRLG